jgi:hypothetical protein
MPNNTISDVKHEKIRVLKSGKNIYGQINTVLSLVLGNGESEFFAYLHKSGKKILFNHTKRIRGLH